MSIQDVTSSFVNISDAPYIIDEAWINNLGMRSNALGQTLALPGLYPQGSTILSVSLLSPEANLCQGAGGPLNAGSVLQVWATGNAGAGARLLLDSVTHTNGQGCPGTGLGQTLPADSWLYVTLGGDEAFSLANNALGVVVKWTKLTQTQNPGLGL